MAAAVSYPVRAPQWVLTYQGVNITADISPMVLAITYVDRLDNASGEVEVELEDHAKRCWAPSSRAEIRRDRSLRWAMPSAGCACALDMRRASDSTCPA